MPSLSNAPNWKLALVVTALIGGATSASATQSYPLSDRQFAATRPANTAPMTGRIGHQAIKISRIAARSRQLRLKAGSYRKEKSRGRMAAPQH
jgi:hypothetical protein